MLVYSIVTCIIMEDLPYMANVLREKTFAVVHKTPYIFTGTSIVHQAEAIMYCT